MNTSNTPSSSSSHSDFTGGEDRPSYVGGFAYGVGVSLGILVLITTITLASYFCTRDDGSSENQQEQEREQEQERRNNNDHCVIAIKGIDEDTLKTYPKCLYSQIERINKKGSTVSCSICLGDYKGRDVVRQLPECGHVFHLKCVDPWLRRHPTCPLCRTSPLPTPQSTPLAEVVPLPANRTG